MPSMMDASCPKCRKRFGWSGRASEQPECPRCGYRPEQEDLEAADRAMAEMQKLLASCPTSETIRKQRIAAGLSLRQAAKLLLLQPRHLNNLELGREMLGPEIEARMKTVYHVGGG